ncbi:hypothetical protein [Streptomyces sp. NPDC101150]|uniref:hypothetical protein n=1 Tax=Streptomyces sp. NPDC101150 TaxID=3366114 RepID=UPI00380EA131
MPLRRPPAPGDLLGARVIDVGDIALLDDPGGRPRRLWNGDLLIGVCATRYATHLYEGAASLDTAVAHLLSSGGTIGTVITSHADLANPTRLEILGEVHDAVNQPLRLADFALPLHEGDSLPPTATETKARVPTAVLVGTATDSGKTTVGVGLVRGLVAGGRRVGVGKVTGGGAGRDRFSYLDAGADHVVDFVDYGMASTAGYPHRHLTAVMAAQQAYLTAHRAEVIVLEIADGLLQPDTRALVESLPGFADAVVLAAADPLAAGAAVDLLTTLGVRPAAVSGVLTNSPLACREAALPSCVPVIGTRHWQDAAAWKLLGPAFES